MIKIKFKFKFFAPFSELFIINFAITKVISAYVLTIAARSPGPTELKLHKKRSRAHCSVVTTKKKRSRAHCTNIEALGLEPTVQKLQRDHGASIAAGVPEPTVQVKTLREKGPGPTVQTLLQGTLSPLNNIPRGSRARVYSWCVYSTVHVKSQGTCLSNGFPGYNWGTKISQMANRKSSTKRTMELSEHFFPFWLCSTLPFYIIFHVPIPQSFCRLWPWLLTTITYPKFHRQFFTTIMFHCPSSILPDYWWPYPCSILRFTWLLLSISLFHPPFYLTIAVHILILSSI